MRLCRVYHPYYNWEEIKYNMWGTVSNKDKYLLDAIKFTSDHEVYGSYMLRVIKEWPISCENALTDYFINRKAWIGHAASALAIGCPENITRMAWRELTDVQQFLANEKARRAIQAWEYSYIKDKKLYKNMENEMLF